jgi:hypothetical protein
MVDGYQRFRGTLFPSSSPFSNIGRLIKMMQDADIRKCQMQKISILYRLIACDTYSIISILPEVHEQEKCGGKSSLNLKIPEILYVLFTRERMAALITSRY